MVRHGDPGRGLMERGDGNGDGSKRRGDRG